ncbi:hypothetical protein [Mycolicibacterium moriokaense]|uniref:Uncharacterized protein n=1 Tax=Mycolicibacterium moriokaense TaxID=39691 RepID=A0A318H5E0_9MYCO|nr:hypothetical protein [Mycolicibacterium moriokaense]PXW99164.1 hypothetical protein C8E89_14126 [Mycolicibacterium moriokaense]
MQVRKSGVAAIFAATTVAVGITAAPIAIADTCDPTATVCQGGDVQTNTSSPDYAPTVSAADDQYPYDSDWYFNSPGGNNNSSSTHSGGGSSGGGGGGGHH